MLQSNEALTLYFRRREDNSAAKSQATRLRGVSHLVVCVTIEMVSVYMGYLSHGVVVFTKEGA